MNKLFLNSTLLIICAALFCCCHKDKVSPVAPAKSTDKNILFFTFIGLPKGEIDQIKKTIQFTVPAGTIVTALKPVIQVSEKASVNPASNQLQDFTKEIAYTITAEDGSKQEYKVIVKTSEVPTPPIITPSTPPIELGSTVTDIDGNVYHTIQIGSQVWMTENLKTTKYRNGEAIPNVIDKQTWRDLTTGAYWDGNNDPFNSQKYGRRYNWYAVDNRHHIAPTGWRVPSSNDWTILIDYLGGKDKAGGKLQENNGFKALISDCRRFNGGNDFANFSF